MKTKMKNKLIVSLLCASVGAVSLSLAVANINVASAEENALTMTMTNSASIRYNDPTGIRFETTYSATDFSAYENYTFGTLVIPSDLLDGELTHETENVQDIRKIGWYKDEANEKVMRSVLTGIPDNFYGRILTARSYYFDGTEYTYSNTVERGIAQTASLLLSQGKASGHEADLNAYVDAVSEGLTASLTAGATIDMVVGGQETITATTNPANYGVVWSSSNKEVATVSNGVIKAVANGETTVTVAFGTEYEYSYTVKVADYVQDEFAWYQNTGGGTYTQATGEIGGRSNVYLFSAGSTQNWNDKLMISKTAHAEGEKGALLTYNALQSKAYNYITFDFYMESGAYFRIGGRDGGETSYTEAHINGDAKMNTRAGTTFNDKIAVFKRGAQVDYTYTGQWYTAVVNYKDALTASYMGGWVFISVSGAKGNIYFDNVRLYSDKELCDAYASANTVYDANGDVEYIGYDGSEFVFGNHENASSVYAKTENGYYKWTTNSWTDRLMIYESGHSLGSNNVANDVVVPFTSTLAFNNLTNLGYNYITFDFCLESGRIRLGSPDKDGIVDQRIDYIAGSNLADIVTSQGVVNTNDNATLYVRETGVKVEMGTKVQANVWYTVVIDHVTAKAPESTNGWTAIYLTGQGTVYLDNVRYYNANPFA